MRHYAGQYFHVFNRGVDKRDIFINEGNYLFLLHKLKEYLPRYPLTLIAYCLMPNHYHLLIRVEKDGALSPFIQRVFNSYVQAFNKQHNRSGTLFQGRVKYRLVLTNEYFYHVPRYIHLNPVKAGLVSKPEDWHYSNYQEFVELRNGTLYSKDFLKDQFGSAGKYREFVESKISLRAKRYIESMELER